MISLSPFAGARLTAAFAAMLDGGSIQIRSGDTRHGELLATLNFADPAFSPPSSDGVCKATDMDRATAVAGGRASWARLTDRSGEVVLDCDVGVIESAAAITLNTVNIVRDGPVWIKGCSLAMLGG